MNKIYKDKTKKELYTPIELADKANKLTKNNPFSSFDFDESKKSRIFGDLCYCNGCGEFIIIDSDKELDSMNISEHGGKRWIYCLKCGQYSHL